MLTSMGISIDRVGGRGFGVTKGNRIEGNLATNKGRGQAEMVLSSIEGAEHDTD